ncbi:phosphoglycerate mutase family protein [Pontibacter silvestris]|uniref:Phosphoglycerate mutase family protein n=1 Tax=Pontibacter silvestris TaxID=2305183 RepID=A0ABW4WW34_9BACT|nr:histidine phosphatase family protein [Pontibacter silvestris]MCC9137441.1 histidine phosphatase family protein [Pontibacter silvestris]
MVKISLTILVLFASLSASAQRKNPNYQMIENIAQKYKELNAQAGYVKVNDVPVAQDTRFIRPEDEVVPDYNNLRQIALVRHGEPDLLKDGKFSFKEARQFVKDYDSVGIVVPDKPFLNIKNTDEVAIFTSSINRARATAKYLFGDNEAINVSHDFREFETYIGKLIPKFRLPIKFWTTTARIKWILGIKGKGVESFADAKKRAKKAANLLDRATEEKPKVVLVAHGFLNRYIKKNLENMGWRVVSNGGSNYLATTILVKIEEKANNNNDNLSVRHID